MSCYLYMLPRPNLQIVMLTVYNDSEQIFKALEMGASGYLLKRTTPDEILKAFSEVHHGGAPMSGYIARQVVQSFARRSNPESPELTPREAEVLALVGKGYINASSGMFWGFFIGRDRGLTRRGGRICRS